MQNSDNKRDALTKVYSNIIWYSRNLQYYENLNKLVKHYRIIINLLDLIYCNTIRLLHWFYIHFEGNNLKCTIHTHLQYWITASIHNTRNSLLIFLPTDIQWQPKTLQCPLNVYFNTFPCPNLDIFSIIWKLYWSRVIYKKNQLNMMEISEENSVSLS